MKPIAETDASGNVVSFFVYGTSALSPDTMDKDGVTYRFIRDVQGSVRLVVDSATGLVAQRLDYDAFGNVLLDTNPGFQPFGFQSGLYDPDTALVQFGARWYDAASGRWLSKDPILLEGGLNLYVFCGNDPVNYADPWGLCEEGGQRSSNIWEEPGISDMSFEFIGFYLGNLASTRAAGWVGGKLGRCASWIRSLFRPSATKSLPPVGDDVVSLFHQGNLYGGQVSDTRYLSTSPSSELLHYRPQGRLYEFQVPRRTLNQWLDEGSALRLNDLHAPSGIMTPEIRILPPASGQINQFLVPSISP